MTYKCPLCDVKYNLKPSVRYKLCSICLEKAGLYTPGTLFKPTQEAMKFALVPEEDDQLRQQKRAFTESKDTSPYNEDNTYKSDNQEKLREVVGRYRKMYPTKEDAAISTINEDMGEKVSEAWVRRIEDRYKR